MDMEATREAVRLLRERVAAYEARDDFDAHLVTELTLWVDNDFATYRRAMDYLGAVRRYIDRGDFDASRAMVGAKNGWALEAVRNYRREFASDDFRVNAVHRLAMAGAWLADNLEEAAIQEAAGV